MYAFMSDEERADAVRLEEANIKLDRAMLAYEAACINNDLKMREIQNRVFAEDGDAIDLADAFTEAAEQAKKDEKGFLQKVWEGICNLFRTISETLFGKKKQATSDVEMSETDHKILGKVRELCGKLKETIKSHKFFSSLIVIGVVITAIHGLKSKSEENAKNGNKEKNVTVKADEVNAAQSEMEDAAKTVNDMSDEKAKGDGTDQTDSQGNKESDTAKKSLGIIQWVQGKLKALIDTKAGQAVKRAKDTAKEKGKGFLGKFKKKKNEQPDNNQAKDGQDPNQQQGNNQNNNQNNQQNNNNQQQNNNQNDQNLGNQS